MQAEESVEIEHLIFGNRDAGPHRVVILFAIGNNDVESVGCAALEDHDQPLARRDSRGLRQHGAHKKVGHRRGAGNGQRALVQEKSAVQSA